MATTLEQVREAYQNLSDDDKKKFDGERKSDQTVSDRVHESIAAQETDEGDKDSQSAEDREHEALGAEHADERREERTEERREDHGDGRGLEERLDRLIALMESRMEQKENKMDAARERYGVAAREIPADREVIDSEEAMRRLRSTR